VYAEQKEEHLAKVASEEQAEQEEAARLRREKETAFRSQMGAQAKASLAIQKRARVLLARNVLDAKVDNYGHEMLFRCSRTLSDGNQYHVFFMRKLGEENPSEFYYVITLRNVVAIEDIYDLELSIPQCKKIFVRKEHPDDSAIVYENNKEAFRRMLDYLDINANGDFKLDIANFKRAMDNAHHIQFEAETSDSSSDEKESSREQIKEMRAQNTDSIGQIGQNIGSSPDQSQGSIQEVDS